MGQVLRMVGGPAPVQEVNARRRAEDIRSDCRVRIGVVDTITWKSGLMASHTDTIWRGMMQWEISNDDPLAFHNRTKKEGE